MKVQLVVAAAAVVVGAVFLWPRLASESGGSSVAADRDSLVAPTRAPVIADSGNETRAGDERSAVAVSSAAVEHVLVFGDLRGAEGVEFDSGGLSFVDDQGASRSATVNARGSYSIFGLKPGAYRITSSLRGLVPLDEELVLPADQAKLRHDIAIERALVLPVKLIDRATGEPIPPAHGSWRSGLAAVATRDRPVRIEGVLGRAPSRTETGVWRATEVLARAAQATDGCAGMLEIWEPPAYVSCVLREVVIESRLVRGDERELVFELDLVELAKLLASMRVRCVDGTTGNPIPSAFVEASVADSSGAGSPTDSNGVVSIAEIAPGWRRLGVRVDGYCGYQRWLHFEPGVETDLGTVALLPKARLRGRVVDASGAGVSVRLSAYSLRGIEHPRDFASNRIYESSTDGSFDVDWVESDRVRLVAVDEAWAVASLDVDARSGAVDGLELRLERGTEVWLRTPRGTRGAVNVLVADSAGRSLRKASIGAITGDHLRLKRGDYELHVYTDGGVVRRQSLQVGGERVVIEVAAP